MGSGSARYRPTGPFLASSWCSRAPLLRSEKLEQVSLGVPHAKRAVWPIGWLPELVGEREPSLARAPVRGVDVMNDDAGLEEPVNLVWGGGARRSLCARSRVGELQQFDQRVAVAQ